VKIGEQTWMAENLNYNAKGSKCYDNKEANCKKYGRLYNWATTKTACPSGWHLPNASDWDILMKYVQTDNGNTYTSGSKASVAGKYLKTKNGWEGYLNAKGVEENGNGEDKYGFAALPGGWSTSDGRFGSDGYDGYWWSSSERDSDYAYYRHITDDGANWDEELKGYLYSVRCVTDTDRYLFEQNFAENDTYVSNIGFSAGKRVIYKGSVKLLDEAIPETALAILDKKELRLLRNAIYAKHGVIFQSDDLKKYFPKFAWYKPQSKNVDDKLTEIDKENAARIQAFENAKPKPGLSGKDLINKYQDTAPAKSDSHEFIIRYNSTIEYKGNKEHSFKGDYKIENGFLVVLVKEQRIGNPEYIHSKNWQWPSGITFKDGIVTYKEPVKLVFPIGDTGFGCENDCKWQQIGSQKWWIEIKKEIGSSLTYEGQTYKIVVIGKQTWMAENLNYNAEGSKCYDNDESNCKKYGRLYDWETAMSVCHSGWHLPSKEEWEVLNNFVGGSKTEGKHLKAVSGWDKGNGQDTYGFSALPGGMSNYKGDFNHVGSLGNWWRSTENDSSSACGRDIDDSESAGWGCGKNGTMFSVRCVKD
jgi:uncharacterized protein (TIGR02145 family)